MTDKTHPVDEMLAPPKLFTLGLQHVLVMYAGAVAVPLIVGRALKLPPEDVAFLISADLFVCGIVTLIQSLGATQWFGIRLPVMMGVTFAAVGPMVAMANAQLGAGVSSNDAARAIFGAIMAAGVISLIIAPFVSKMLRFFPPVVTGTIILVIGISLMRIGINWIFGNPVGPTAPQIIDPAHADWLKAVTEGAAAGTISGLPEVPQGLALAAKMNNPLYASSTNIIVSAIVLISILMIAKFGKGFIANIAVLLGIVIGAVIAVAMGTMNFAKVGEAAWFGLITPFHFGAPTFDFWMILTMTLVMIVVMIESTGMFLALGDMTGKKVDQPALSAGLRTDETRADTLEVPDRAVLLVLAAKQAVHEVVDLSVRETKAGIAFVCHSFLLPTLQLYHGRRAVACLPSGSPRFSPMSLRGPAALQILEGVGGIPP